MSWRPLTRSIVKTVSPIEPPHRRKYSATSRRPIDRICGIEDIPGRCPGLDRLLRLGMHLDVEIISIHDVRRRIVANIDAGLRARFVVIVDAPNLERDDVALHDFLGGRGVVHPSALRAGPYADQRHVEIPLARLIHRIMNFADHLVRIDAFRSAREPGLKTDVCDARRPAQTGGFGFRGAGRDTFDKAGRIDELCVRQVLLNIVLNWLTFRKRSSMPIVFASLPLSRRIFTRNS